MPSEHFQGDSTIGRIVQLWFGLDRPVDRRSYALSGFGLMALKYGLDAALVKVVADRFFTPLDYLSPLLNQRTELLGPTSEWLLVVMVLLTVPFLWVGVSMTIRRAEDAGLPAGTGLVFFVPVLNYVAMLTLCLLPSRPRPAAGHPSPVDSGEDTRSILLALFLGGLITTAMVFFSILLLGSYGSGVFVATPFVIGVEVGYLVNRHRARTVGKTLWIATLTAAVAGGSLLLFALEGIICMVMAGPIVLIMTYLGAVLGRSLVSRRRRTSLALFLVLPLAGFADSRLNVAPLREVVTTIEVDAPPATVWENVIGFGKLPAPSSALKKLGIAYPVQARLEGSGVGAIRYCEFSTGPFVEPITVWEPPSRLGFDVQQSPPAMTEWSPYRKVHAPHLEDNLLSERGEFRLIALDGGRRTRLEGSTWYRMEMAPQIYWSVWSDAIIHRIHARVLAHVKASSESS